MKQTMRMIGTLAIWLAVALITPSVGWTQPATQPNSVGDFIHSLTGEWIGTYQQWTNGQAAEDKYCHAVIKQSGPNSYRTVMDYYRIDDQTGAPIKIGQSTMTTEIAPDGSATNKVVGKGQVMIDPKTSKPEQHDLSEILQKSSSGLRGAGSGTVNVTGMPFGVGKNGRVNDSRTAWTMRNDTLTISQDIKVGFKVLMFSKSFDIKAEFTAKRGSDIIGLMSAAGGGSGRDSS